MKTMKKLLALVMALALCLSLGVCAMADDVEEGDGETTEETTVESSPTVVKVVSGSGAPDETYSFTVTATGMTDTATGVGTTQPAVTVDDIKNSGSANLDLSAITAIGIYNYTISEKAGNTAGMEYDKSVYTLTVTASLVDGELKKDVSIKLNGVKVESATFTNTYTANTLTVTKDVTGNLGDTTKEFSFTVTFANNNDAITWVNAITYNSDTTGAASVIVNGNTVTFTLSDSDSITFSNIPSGITYTVTEESYASDGYTTKIGGTETSTTTGTMAGENVSVTVVNDKDQTVDTGITLDSLPYVLVLVAVLALGAVMIIRKRRVED